MKNSWITLALFEDAQAGEAFTRFLNDNRMEARTYNDKVLQHFLFLCPPQATYRVQVRDRFFKMAGKLVETNPPVILEKAIHCPDCGSIRVNYPQMTRKFFLPTVFLHLGIIFRVIKHQAYCEHCHCMWTLPKAGSPEFFEAVPQPPIRH